MEKGDKGSTLTRMGVSGWMFLLVPAYPGCPGQTAVKWLLLLLLFFPQRCGSRQISGITCVLRTETITSSCYVNRQIKMSLLSTYQNCCRLVLTYWLTDWRHQWLTNCWSCTRVGDSCQRLETRVRLESPFLRLVTYLRLALIDWTLDLRLEHIDLRLTRDSTLKTRDLLATCDLQVLMLLTNRHKRWIREYFYVELRGEWPFGF